MCVKDGNGNNTLSKEDIEDIQNQIDEKELHL